MNTTNGSPRFLYIKQYWLVMLLIGFVSTLHYITPHGNHGSGSEHAGHVMDASKSFDWNAAFHGIYRRLYYFPIILAAFRGGMRGGLGAALLVVIIYLPHAFAVEWGLDRWVMADPGMLAEKILEILLYLAMGLLAGQLVERLNLTSRNLAHTAENLQQTLDEKIAVEQELVRSARLAAVGRLSAGLAHEIRNPLASINLFTDILCDEDKYDRTDQENELFVEIKDNINRVDKIIKRVLSFAKPPVATSDDIDLNELTQEIIKFWSSKLRKLNIVLNLELKDDLPAVQGDVISLQQVINNVVLNAIEAMGEGGDIRIRTLQAPSSMREDQDAVYLKVSDTGPGIPKHQQEDIFNPFFTTKPTGTGLGLSISHQIIKRHGGSFSLESILETGTTFIIELPAASSKQKRNDLLPVESCGMEN